MLTFFRPGCVHQSASGQRSYQVCVVWGEYNVLWLKEVADVDRCPGLTSKGAFMPTESDIPVDTVVAVMAEGKEHALAVGQMKMSSSDIRSINKGIGVETLTSLGDPLWSLRL